MRENILGVFLIEGRHHNIMEVRPRVHAPRPAEIENVMNPEGDDIDAGQDASDGAWRFSFQHDPLQRHGCLSCSLTCPRKKRRRFWWS